MSSPTDAPERAARSPWRHSLLEASRTRRYSDTTTPLKHKNPPSWHMPVTRGLSHDSTIPMKEFFITSTPVVSSPLDSEAYSTPSRRSIRSATPTISGAFETPEQSFFDADDGSCMEKTTWKKPFSGFKLSKSMFQVSKELPFILVLIIAPVTLLPYACYKNPILGIPAIFLWVFLCLGQWNQYRSLRREEQARRLWLRERAEQEAIASAWHKWEMSDPGLPYEGPAS